MFRPLVPESKQLRKKSTDHELKLWRYLRNRSLSGYKFRRQYVIEPYIADFCCPDQNLVIELDGGEHNHPIKISKDQKRDNFLKEKGYKILRIWNSEIDQNIEGVLQSIINFLSSPSPQKENKTQLNAPPHPNLLPKGRRDSSSALCKENDISWQKPFRFFPKNPVWDETKDWVLEIGPGNGKFITWLAAQQPQKLFIAVELRNMRFQGVGTKSEKAAIENIISVHGDARYCLPYVFKEKTLTEIYILFPDPWFKRRHYKHRLINTERTELFHSLLKKDGKVYFASDNQDYAAWVKKSFPEEKWKFEEGNSLYPTYFETKWKMLGRSIHYFVFVKKE